MQPKLELFKNNIITTNDEILTYEYVNSQDLGFPTEETPRLNPQDRPGAQELYPSGTLARTLRLRNLFEPEHANGSTQGSRAHPSLKRPIDNMPELSPWLLPSSQRQLRPGYKKTSLKLSRLGGSQTLHFKRGFAGRSRDRVTHGARHKKTCFFGL